MQVYMVTLYPAHQRIAGDCLPEFFATRTEAMNEGHKHIAACKASRERDGDNLWNWPVRFTIRKETFHD